MIEYKTQKNEYGDIIECESCGSEAPVAEFRNGPKLINPLEDPGKRKLCEFCASTLTGTYTEYPAQDQFTSLRREIWTAAACLYNGLKHGLEVPKEE